MSWRAAACTCKDTQRFKSLAEFAARRRKKIQIIFSRDMCVRENTAQAAMTGISGTSKTGTKYHYYQCVTNRRDKSCHKKTVSKAYIEDLVIKETRKLLTKENIDRIAKEVVRLCEQEKDTDNLKRLKRLLKENERATENLFKALESGQIVDVIAERISQKKRERNELEQQILVETSSHPTPTVNEVRFFLNQFRKGDVNDLKYRQALVDTFVNRIYLYDDKMTVLYNTQDSHSDVTIDDLSSSRVALVEPRGIEPLSENSFTGLSPGAVRFQNSRPAKTPDRLCGLVES